MARAFATLLAFQWVGEILARLADLPVPGPVIGLSLLLATLALRERWGAPLPASLDRAASGLLAHLSLLFVPAGVGVLAHVDRLAAEATALGLVVVAGTGIAMAVTGLLTAALLERREAS